MTDDLTDLLLESLEEADVDYTEPEDIITVEEVLLYTPLHTPGGKIKNINKVPFEKIVENFDLPDDITVEEMKSILYHMNDTGKPRVHSEETRMRIAISMTGTTRPEETKAKISSKMSNRQLSDDHKANISKSMCGKKRKPMTEETKEKIRQARLNRTCK